MNLSIMAIEKLQTDDDDELDANVPGTGPLGKLVEQDSTQADEDAEAAEPRPPRPQFDPRTEPSDYGKGTREHDDDREP